MAKEDFEDEQYTEEEHAEESKEDVEEELEDDGVADWEEGFEKGATAAEFEDGKEEEAEEEETPKKKKDIAVPISIPSISTLNKEFKLALPIKLNVIKNKRINR